MSYFSKKIYLLVAVVFVVTIGLFVFSEKSLTSDYYKNEDSGVYVQVLDNDGSPLNSATVSYYLFSHSGTLVGSGSMAYIIGTSGLYSQIVTMPSDNGNYVLDIRVPGLGLYGSSDLHVSGTSAKHESDKILDYLNLNYESGTISQVVIDYIAANVSSGSIASGGSLTFVINWINQNMETGTISDRVIDWNQANLETGTISTRTYELIGDDMDLFAAMLGLFLVCAIVGLMIFYGFRS